MPLLNNNPWLGYAERSYSTIKNAIVSKLQNPTTGIPEITDHSSSNPFIKRVSIWAGIAEMLGYYIDNKGRESFLSTARLLNSAVDLAKQYDYRIRGRVPSSGQVTITINNPAPSDITIPAETIVSTSSGLRFLTISPGVILTGDTSVIINIKQYTKVPYTQIGVTDGSDFQVFTLNKKVADGSVSVKVDTDIYSSVNSFTLKTGSDKVFLGQVDKDGIYQVELGDGINGFLPVASKVVEAEYYETEGAAGNVGATLINTLVSNLTLPAGISVLSVSNSSPTTNGKDQETLADLKKYIPLSLRTLYRAVTRQDYIDVTLLAPGVSNAGLNYGCGKYVDIYITPNGGGEASPALIADTQNFLDDRKMVTTFVRVFAAGLVFVEHTIKVRALTTYYNNVVKNNVLATLEEFYSNENQVIGGINYLGNVYQAIENTEGVESCDIDLMRPVPAAIPVDLGQVALDWTRQQTGASTAASYRIVFVTSTDYKLYRNNVFIGSFSIGTFISQIDINFTVNAAAYNSGDKYTFNTYSSSGNIALTEPSLLTYDVQYIDITVTGGLS